MSIHKFCLFRMIKKTKMIIFVIVLCNIAVACISSTNATPIPSSEYIPTQDDVLQKTTPANNQTIYFPQQEPVEGERETMTAEVFGTLVVVDKCIRVKDEEFDTSWLLIWPPNFTLSIENNSIQILDENGNAMARVGDWVRIGGGEVKSSNFFSETMKQKLPPNCLAPYWIVGDEVSTLKLPE